MESEERVVKLEDRPVYKARPGIMDNEQDCEGGQSRSSTEDVSVVEGENSSGLLSKPDQDDNKATGGSDDSDDKMSIADSKSMSTELKVKIKTTADNFGDERRISSNRGSIEDVQSSSMSVKHLFSPASSSGGASSSCQTSPSSSLSSSAALTPASSPITTSPLNPGVLSSAVSKMARPVAPRVHPKPEKPVLRDRSGRKRNNSLDSEFVTNFPTRKERTKSLTPRAKPEEAKKPRPRGKPPFPKERTVGKPKPKVDRPGIKFEVGFRLEAMDSFRNKWYNAKIVQVEEHEQMILVHFDRWNSRYDEWIDCDSNTIRPMRVKSRLKLKRKQEQVMRSPKKTAPPPLATPPPQQPQQQQPQPKMQQNQQEEETVNMVGDFQYGEEVLARWSDCRYYPAKVLSLNKNGTYRMLFYDGIEKNVLGTNTRTMPDELKQMSFFSNFNLPPAPVVKGKKRWSAKDQTPQEPTLQAPAAPSSSGPTSPRTTKRRLSDTQSAPLTPPLASLKKAKTEESPKPPPVEPPKTAEVETKVRSPKQKVTSPAERATLPLPPAVDVKPFIEPVLPPAKREEILSRNIKEPILNDKALGLLRDRPTHYVAPKELVIDLDHNKYKCNFKDCDKSFRKQSLLEYHKKYYHATKTRASTAATKVLSRTKKMFKESGKLPSKVSPRKRLSAPPELVSSYQSRLGEKTTARRRTKYPASVPRRRQSQSPPPVMVKQPRQRHLSEPILARGLSSDASPSPLAKVVEGVSLGGGAKASPPPADPATILQDSKAEEEAAKDDMQKLAPGTAELEPVPEESSPPQKTTVQKPGAVPKLVDDKRWRVERSSVPEGGPSRSTKRISKKRKNDGGRSRAFVLALQEDVLEPVVVPGSEEDSARRHHKHKKDKDRKRHKKRKKEERRHQQERAGELPSESDGASPGGTPAEGTFKQPHSRVSVRHSGTTSRSGANKEVVKCVCKVPEEAGFMIQCEACDCWQHSVCVGLSVKTVPKRYVCYYCQIAQGHKPPLFDQEDYAWYEKGELPVMPSFKKGERKGDPRAASLRLATNSLLGDVITLVEVLEGVQQKIAILQNPDHPEARLWARDWIIRSRERGLRFPLEPLDSSAVATAGRDLRTEKDVSSKDTVPPGHSQPDKVNKPPVTQEVSRTGSDTLEVGSEVMQPVMGTTAGGDVATSSGKVDGSNVPSKTAAESGDQSLTKTNTIIIPIPSKSLVEKQKPASSSSPADASSSSQTVKSEMGTENLSPSANGSGDSGDKSSPTRQSPVPSGQRSSDKVSKVATASGHFVVRPAIGPIAEHNYVATKPRYKVQSTRIGQPKTTFEPPSFDRGDSSGKIAESNTSRQEGVSAVIPQGGGKVGPAPAEDTEEMEVDVDDSSEEVAINVGILSADKNPVSVESSQDETTDRRKPGSGVSDTEPSVELSQRYLLRHINTMHDQLSERMTLIEMEVEKLEKMFAGARAEWRADSEDSTALRKKMRVLLGDLQKIETIVSY